MSLWDMFEEVISMQNVKALFWPSQIAVWADVFATKTGFLTEYRPVHESKALQCLDEHPAFTLLPFLGVAKPPMTPNKINIHIPMGEPERTLIGWSPCAHPTPMIPSFWRPLLLWNLSEKSFGRIYREGRIGGKFWVYILLFVVFWATKKSQMSRFVMVF